MFQFTWIMTGDRIVFSVLSGCQNLLSWRTYGCRKINYLNASLQGKENWFRIGLVWSNILSKIKLS